MYIYNKKKEKRRKRKKNQEEKALTIESLGCVYDFFGISSYCMNYNNNHNVFWYIYKLVE